MRLVHDPGKAPQIELAFTLYTDGTALISFPSEMHFWWALAEIEARGREFYAKARAQGGLVRALVTDPRGHVPLGD